MATVVVMPKLSATMEEATVAAWHKSAGDPVSSGETILDIETDKTTLTIEAPVAGRFGTPRVAAGEVAAVGTPLVVILADGEQETADLTSASGAGSLRNSPREGRSSDASSLIPTADEPIATAARRLFASPLARRQARELGVDLNSIRGTGPNGRIVRADVDRLYQLNGIPRDRKAGSRRQTALQVMTSRREIPAFTLARWIDMEGILEQLSRSDSNRSETDYLLYAITRAIGEVSAFRCVWNSQRMIAEDLGATNIGLVVSTDHGLLIPVLDNMDRADLAEMSVRRRMAVTAARDGKLDRGYMARASVSLSSLIRDEADEFEAIISPDQTAIVAVGRIMERVVARNGVILIRRGCVVSVSADHRLIDGRAGATFIGVLARVLEK